MSTAIVAAVSFAVIIGQAAVSVLCLGSVKRAQRRQVAELREDVDFWRMQFQAACNETAMLRLRKPEATS